MFARDDRVRVTNQSLDTWGMDGTVWFGDRHGQVWVRLDGHGQSQFSAFAPSDLSPGRPTTDPLQYAANPTGPMEP